MELNLVVVGANVVTAIAHRRGLEPALIIVVVGIAASFLPGFEAPEPRTPMRCPIRRPTPCVPRCSAGLYREVLSAQRAALIAERDGGCIDEEAVRAMLERLDLQEAGVSARLESRF